MALSVEEYAAGKEELLRVLNKWNLREDSVEVRGNLFDSWLESVQRRGWVRKDVYRLVCEILDEFPSQFSEATLDELLEVETGLTGFCHVDSIIRFPNEPADDPQLLAYVHGNLWR